MNVSKTVLIRLVLIALVLLGGWLYPAAARTWVIPHVLETSGSVANTQFTFDTTVFITYTDSVQPGRTGSAQVDLYLFEQATGQPMEGNTGPVCAPCTFQLRSDQRKLSLSVDSLINSQAGGFDSPVKLGFGIVVVSGPDADAVNVQAVANNAHTSAFDVSLIDLGAKPLPTGTNVAVRTYVVPHVLETSGRTSTDPFSFDTTIFATYAGGLAGIPDAQTATLDLYLFDQQTGLPMLSGTDSEICNPCTFQLGNGAGGTPTPRKQTITIDSLIQNAGGFGPGAAKLGFAVVEVGGADPDNVALHGFVVNSHTSAFDLSVFGFEPQPISSSAAARTLVIPHILERSGTVASTPFTFDTTIYATYVSGLAGIPGGSSANLSLYLFDSSGQPMTGATSPICNPCNFKMGDPGDGTPSVRKQTINIEELISQNGGGFDTAVKLGFGVVVVDGDDPDGVNLQGFVVNSHTSAFDLSVFGFEPQEIRPAASMAPRSFVLPHVLERDGSIANTQFTFDTTVFATYAGGLGGIPDGGGAELKLYLYNQDGTGFLTANSGAVCAPCTFPMDASSPKATINVENLIANAGGFDQPVKLGSGLIVLGGDVANVALQSHIVNAKTGPFDLSVFGYEPQPLQAARLSPFNLQISKPGAGVTVSLPTVIGYNYRIETNHSFSPGGWKAWKSFEGTGLEETIPDSDTKPGTRFYRGVAE